MKSETSTFPKRKDSNFQNIDQKVQKIKCKPSVFHDPAIEWLRPHEICDDPKFYSSGDNEDEAGASQFDVVQGSLGDCWMLAAMAILSQNEDMLHRVAPPQSFDPEEGYDGKFKFTFWQYGQWIDVTIDDRLPTRNGSLIFTQSSTNNEFWTALLEKAYAHEKKHNSGGR